MSIEKILERVRPEIRAMKAYSSARSLYQATSDMIFLDANECPYEPYVGAQNLSRYADQQPSELQASLARLYDVSTRNLLITRGADEGIDILIRTFCSAGKDEVMICPPTFPMYEHSSILQGIQVTKVPLQHDFSLNITAIKSAANSNLKIIFLCSPNNPTGNLLSRQDIESILKSVSGKALVVIDETYLEFTDEISLIESLDRFENLVVLRTLSKAYAAAGLRCGVTIARPEIIDLLRKVLPPYPIPQPVVLDALKILSPANLEKLKTKRKTLEKVKHDFLEALSQYEDVVEMYPASANFVLVRVHNADQFCKKCFESGIIVRNQSHQPNLENCVRISIGTAYEMERLINVLTGKLYNEVIHTRKAVIIRKTNETNIVVHVNLDCAAPVSIATGIGFYDHMLEQLAKHGGFSLQLECEGDLHIDAHHSIEDCAIALGQALRQALGDKYGIGRFGSSLPMDESLAQVALDLSGRYYLDFKANFPMDHVGDLPTDMIEHIFRSFAEHLQANIHVDVKGENTHHMVEACFKALGRALRQAIKVEGDALPSTKGIL